MTLIFYFSDETAFDGRPTLQDEVDVGRMAPDHVCPHVQRAKGVFHRMPKIRQIINANSKRQIKTSHKNFKLKLQIKTSTKKVNLESQLKKSTKKVNEKRQLKTSS
jgi:hypothetical protein